MTVLQTLGYAAIGTALIAGVLAIACRIFTRWLIRDLDAKSEARERRIARTERVVRHKGNGRDWLWQNEPCCTQE